MKIYFLFSMFPVHRNNETGVNFLKCSHFVNYSFRWRNWSKSMKRSSVHFIASTNLSRESLQDNYYDNRRPRSPRQGSTFSIWKSDLVLNIFSIRSSDSFVVAAYAVHMCVLLGGLRCGVRIRCSTYFFQLKRLCCSDDSEELRPPQTFYPSTPLKQHEATFKLLFQTVWILIILFQTLIVRLE